MWHLANNLWLSGINLQGSEGRDIIVSLKAVHLNLVILNRTGWKKNKLQISINLVNILL